jgi:hypothetical protein
MVMEIMMFVCLYVPKTAGLLAGGMKLAFLLGIWDGVWEAFIGVSAATVG